MFLSVEEIEGRPERGMSSMISRLSLNSFYHSLARVFDKTDSP